MSGNVLIVGQGLAGTLLGFACEQAGIDFEIADMGHRGAASRVGAGIINPITGQRIVKSSGIDELREPARAMYRELEAILGVSLIYDMRVRRLFRDEAERRVLAAKLASGVLAPYAGQADEQGFWIEGAMRIDTAKFITVARERWLRAGRLREERVELSDALKRYDQVVACTGADEPQAWGGAPCVRAAGHILNIAVEGLAPDVILNRGHWVLPTEVGRARVGATYVRGAAGDERAARVELEASAKDLVGPAPFTVVEQDAGWRVTTPDRKPMVGRDPREGRLGVFNGLGSKGALLAPGLARQWVAHLRGGHAFAADVAVERFAS